LRLTHDSVRFRRAADGKPKMAPRWVVDRTDSGQVDNYQTL